MERTRPPLQTIGWREWVGLPDLGVEAIKTKIDTGARTSALHTFRLEEFTVNGEPWARFEVHPNQRNSRDAVRVETPIAGHLKIRSSNGQEQQRPVIATTIKIDGVSWLIDVTLTNRDEMGFRMLIGRAAIRHRFIVDPARSYLVGRRP